ncbi:glycoside hydrolase family 88 protein [Flectobacillus major]|uniref:glycoside hydrolase family 88 protein n=1 Tax=Flectobacillus major TaxID=103 RepID=UPI00042215C1|nr:glycoside hydrolase family 88 protein [Flectobacillus major]
MKKHFSYLYLVTVCFFVTTFTLFGQNPSTHPSRKALLKIIDQNFIDAAQQYKVLMNHLPQDKFPKTYFPTTGQYQFSGSEWWCSGFYPGSLLYIYQQTQDSVLLKEANRILNILEKEKFNTTTHDLGFMMFCSFGNAKDIAPKPTHKDILIQSAKSLASRFNPTVGCIKSWDSHNNDYLVIIDNMMNLELLFWATQATGDSSYYNIAVTHANTTMKHHFRSDFSSYHVINYNAQTGDVQQKRTAQGYANESAWARGQAWGLYGYTVMYRATQNPMYLEQAKNIARFILKHPNLPTNKIPYWDFNAPNIPDALRDASAAAVMASALLELSTYVNNSLKKEYISNAEEMLFALSKPPYKAKIGTNGGFLIEHCVGHIPEKTEIDVPLTYADYYFLEAMKRYQALQK